jgi:hypothetical protein
LCVNAIAHPYVSLTSNKETTDINLQYHPQISDNSVKINLGLGYFADFLRDNKVQSQYEM